MEGCAMTFIAWLIFIGTMVAYFDSGWPLVLLFFMSFKEKKD